MNRNNKKITSSIRAELAALFVILFSLFIFSNAISAPGKFSEAGNNGDAAILKSGINITLSDQAYSGTADQPLQ